MPTLSFFYGILVRMYWLDHNPPHFHALYGSDEVLISIQRLKSWKVAFRAAHRPWSWNGRPYTAKS